MWAANAATVSPAPDTADGRCHLTVANLRTMPHRSHEWPATLAQLRLAFADARVRGPRPGAARVRRRRRGQSHAAGRRAWRAGRRDIRLWRRRRPLPRAPASRSVEGDCPAPPARSRARPVRRSRSEEAIAAGAFHNDVVAVANGPVLFAHEKAFADRDALVDATAPRALPDFELCRGRRRRSAAGRRDQILSVQRPAGDPARRRDDAGRADRVPRDAVGLGVDRAPPRLATARSAGSNVVDVRQSMANGGGPACLRLRVACDPGDGRSALPGRRGQARPAGARSSRAHWPEADRGGRPDRSGAGRPDRQRARAALLEALDLTEL